MRTLGRLMHALLFAAAVAAFPAGAQTFSANYELTQPAVIRFADPELIPVPGGIEVGRLRAAPAWAVSGSNGAGLSFEAGEAWFARLTLGRSVESGLLSLGGGFRFGDGQSVSMQLTRTGPERLGLAVRYDWPGYYLRVGIDRDGATPDLLRFSAGMRF